jgi:hypothetical protein
MATQTTYQCDKCNKTVVMVIDQERNSDGHLQWSKQSYLISCRHNKVVGDTLYHSSEHRGTYSSPKDWIAK